jgi:hypothetical protein
LPDELLDDRFFRRSCHDAKNNRMTLMRQLGFD